MDAMGLVCIYNSLTSRCFCSNVDGGLLRRSLAWRASSGGDHEDQGERLRETPKLITCFPRNLFILGGNKRFTTHPPLAWLFCQRVGIFWTVFVWCQGLEASKLPRCRGTSVRDTAHGERWHIFDYRRHDGDLLVWPTEWQLRCRERLWWLRWVCKVQVAIATWHSAPMPSELPLWKDSRQERFPDVHRFVWSTSAVRPVRQLKPTHLQELESAEGTQPQHPQFVTLTQLTLNGLNATLHNCWRKLGRMKQQRPCTNDHTRFHLGGGFTYFFMFMPRLFGEMIQFDEHIFQMGGSTTN